MTPTPAATYRTRKRGRTLAAIAATSILAIGAVILAWQFGWAAGGTATPAASNSASVLAAEKQLECITVKREHENWNRSAGKLLVMTPTAADNSLWFKQLKTDGDAYLKAVSGYPDQPSKELAVAVAQYNFDLGLVSLDHQLNGKYATEKLDKALESAKVVLTSYDSFNTRQCAK